MKRYFSGWLYIEGLKKLRVIGILGIILLCAATVIPCVSAEENLFVHTFSRALLPLLIYAPAMVISAFSFLHKRNSSDFFHSLPVSRESMFLSFFLAAFSWTVAAVVICWSLCAVLAVPLMGLSPHTLFVLLPAYLCACLLLSGIAALAVSATGTSFAAGVVFLFSLLTPSLMLDLFVRLLHVAIPSFVATESFLSIFFFDNSMIGEIYSYNGEIVSLLFSLRLYVLTLIMALLFICAAIYIHKRRRSEWATRSAPNVKLRTVYRCLATLPIGIGYTSYILYNLEAFSTVDIAHRYFITLSIFAFLLSVFIWFLLELIFTKKITAALSSLLQYYLLIGGCALFVLCFTLGKSIILNINPAPSEVHSFAVNYMRSSDISYEAELLSDVFVADDDLEQIICDSLASTNQSVKNGKAQITGTTAVVHIRLKSGIVIARKIELEDIFVREIMYRSALVSEEFKEKYLRIPTDSYHATYDWFGEGFNSKDSGVTALSIWNVFSSEYDSLTEEQKFEVKRSAFSDSEKAFLPSITSKLTNGNGRATSIGVYIPEYMTDTRQYYFTLLKSGTGTTHKNIYDEFEKFNDEGYKDKYGNHKEPNILLDCDTMIFTNGERIFGGKLSGDDNDKLMEFLNTILKDSKISKNVPIATQSYITLDMTMTTVAAWGERVTQERTAAISISEETARRLCDILNSETT